PGAGPWETERRGPRPALSRGAGGSEANRGEGSHSEPGPVPGGRCPRRRAAQDQSRRRRRVESDAAVLLWCCLPRRPVDGPRVATMKIIALGDIHGNLPALEVVLRESRAEGYDVVCHTGDLVGFAPFPEETVALMRAEGIQGVRGDLDESVSAQADDFGGNGVDGRVRRLESLAYAWTVQRTERITRRHLADLPFDQRMEAGGRRT